MAGDGKLIKAHRPRVPKGCSDAFELPSVSPLAGHHLTLDADVAVAFDAEERFLSAMMEVFEEWPHEAVVVDDVAQSRTTQPTSLRQPRRW